MLRYIALALLMFAAVSVCADRHPDTWPRSGRPIIDLDGAWEFHMDPADAGESQAWFEPTAPYPDAITVPGCWDAQGFGEPTDIVRSNYVGKAWYRRTVDIPSDWSGKRIVLWVGGVHRYADVWVNGRHVKRHVGYVAPFEVDVTGDARPGEAVTVAIRVDSKQDWEIDALTGAFDIIDYMDVNWGGIWSHVWLEARDGCYVAGAFVQPDVDEEAVVVDVECAASGTSRRDLAVTIVDPDHRVVARSLRSVTVPAGGSIERVLLDVPDAKLWSPNHPWLYRAKVMLSEQGRTTDEWEDRFGMREIEVRGPDIYLNGQRTYLHGYGDDTIYPKTLVPPADHEAHRKRFAVVKAFGLNYVRHHSTVPVPEYFDIADEMGVLVQPELPIAYQPFLDRGLQSDAARELYAITWEAMIKRLRNHPSAFAWCMGNEMYAGNPLADDLYDRAKRLDPTRPVYDSDGVPLGTDRPTLDLLAVQFDVFALPVLEHANKHDFAAAPRLPVISHEMGNFSTYPDLSDIEDFKHVFKPFWLEDARKALAERGLLDEVDAFVETSGKLQALCHKIDIEDQRWSPYTDGHALWLLQDYWTGTTGLVDYYFNIKGPGPEFYRQFIDDVVLLARLPDSCFEGGDEVTVPTAVSDFGEEPLAGQRVRWSLTDGRSMVAGGEVAVPDVGKGLVPLGDLLLQLPRVRTPRKLTLQMELTDHDDKRSNKWSLWVFPSRIDTSAPEDVRVIRRFDSEALNWVASGGRAILLRPEALFPSEPVTFKPAWWRGSPGGDSHAGTVIYDHPALRNFPHEGFCDLQFLRLQHNQKAMLLDGWAIRAGNIIRAIDCHMGNRDKALMLEARIGEGAIIATTLDLSRGALQTEPEARWLLKCLLDYAASPSFSPAEELSLDYLSPRIAESLELADAARVEGFARMIDHIGDVNQEDLYRGEAPRVHVIRGTDGTHKLVWETERAPDGLADQAVCFAWSGGLGWISESATTFTLTVPGAEPVVFGVTQSSTTWRSADSRLRLQYDVDTSWGLDSLGTFYLMVPRELVVAGEPLRIEVTTSASDSKQWMLLHPLGGVWEREGE